MVAGAHGSRTHPGQCELPRNGFEVRIPVCQALPVGADSPHFFDEFVDRPDNGCRQSSPRVRRLGGKRVAIARHLIICSCIDPMVHPGADVLDRRSS